MIPSSSSIVFGNMEGRVNKGTCVCGRGCWGVGEVSESDMRSGGDDITENFVSGFIVNCEHTLSEGRYAKNTVFFWT